MERQSSSRPAPIAARRPDHYRLASAPRPSRLKAPPNPLPAPPPAFDIAPATSAGDLAAVAGLFRAYAASLSIDLNHQAFDAELAALPGPYRAPAGALLLAKGADGAPLGCIALKPLDDPGGEGAACEIKRLYVRPEARGAGLGQALVAAILAAASTAGHAEIKLDTLAEMTAARALYRRFGFTDIPDYGTFPYPGLICLGRRI